MVDQLTAGELAVQVDGDASFTLIDTRTEESFDGWHIHGAENVPFDPTAGFDDDHRRRVEAIADGEQAVVICGKGLTSTPFGLHLEDDGYDDVAVVKGGMEAWGALHEVVEIEGDGVRALQLQRRGTGCLSYLLGPASEGRAIAVDPTRQIDRVAALAQAADWSIEAVVDTHVHADHLSGGHDLAGALDVPYRLGAVETDDHAYEPATAETVARADVPLDVLHTPGHTETMANLVVDDTFVLTSDTLFLESVGRTELGFGDDDADRGAALLHESLHETILALEDDLVVLPGHVSITDDIRFEASRPGEPVARRLGAVAADLALLGRDRDGFVEELTDDLPDKPDDYETVIDVNAGRDTVDSEEAAAELDTGPNDCSA